MKEKSERFNKIKIVITVVFMIFLIFLVTNGTKILQKPTAVFVVEDGTLSYEESSEGYIIRDETVLQGENYKNGMVKVVSDGERAAKNETVFRYYSNNEESILEQIAKLDEEITEIIDNTGMSIVSSDISSIETQIEETVDDMYNLNYVQKIQENKNKIEAYISKKVQITGTLSPSDSYVKTLTEQRNNLEKELENGSEIMQAPESGMVSYRVDGLEEILVSDNFDYLTSELLEGFDLKVGAVIPLSDEKGKIVNNFECYIAVPTDSEKAMLAQVGDTVILKLSNSDEIDAEIVYIKEEDQKRILVFEIEEDVSDLLEYRKISFDIIWWKYEGLKVSNSCIIDEDDKAYVERTSAGYTEKILVKVLRQNDTYSIIENYSDEELENLGYSEEEISDMKTIKLYDEIILH